MKRLQRKRDEAKRVGGEEERETEVERTMDEYEREREGGRACGVRHAAIALRKRYIVRGAAVLLYPA